MDSLLLLCNYTDDVHGKLYTQINGYLKPMRKYPVVPLLTFKEPQGFTLKELFDEAVRCNTPMATARLLQAVLSAEVESTFHKINVHAALTPDKIKEMLEPVFRQAEHLQDTAQSTTDSPSSSLYFTNSPFSATNKTPFVTVSQCVYYNNPVKYSFSLQGISG